MHHDSVDSMWLAYLDIFFRHILFKQMTYTIFMFFVLFHICRLQRFLRLHFDLELESQFDSHGKNSNIFVGKNILYKSNEQCWTVILMSWVNSPSRIDRN